MRACKKLLGYMCTADDVAQMSTSNKRKVGAVLIMNDMNTYCIGYNHNPDDMRGPCEGPDGKTLPKVVHAEQHAVQTALKAGQDFEGSILVVNTAPCIKCAKLLTIVGVSEVYYKDEYKNREGLDYLIKADIIVKKWEHYINGMV